MKLINTTRRSLLLGIALLGATTFVGFATPASAQTRDDQNAPQSSDTHDKHPDTNPARPIPQRHDSPNTDARQNHHHGRGPGQSSSSQDRPDFRSHIGKSESERHNFQDRSRRQDQGQNQSQPDFQHRADAPKDGDWHQGDGQDRNRPDHPGYRSDYRFDDGNRSNAQLRPRYDRSDRQGQERENYQEREDDRNRSDHRGSGHASDRTGDQGRFDDRRGDQGRFENREPNWDKRQGIGNPNRESRDSGNSYTGTVTKVRSDQSFDVNIGGNTFNVYTSSRTPSGLSKGDTVRINGEQKYNNDIRDARVSIVRNS